jgi:hypothetical protein
MTRLLKHDRACLNLLRRVDPTFWNPLDPPPVPKTWTGPHVGLRLCEGLRTLKALPLNGHFHGLRSLASWWPAYRYEFEDLLAQTETAELERTMRAQNVAKVQPSAHAVAIAEAAIYWPMKYLGQRFPDLAVAVNAVALAHSIERDAGWVVRKRGGFADTWRSRHDRGCDLIATGLTADRTPVF